MRKRSKLNVITRFYYGRLIVYSPYNEVSYVENKGFDLLKDELKLQTNFAIFSINNFNKSLQELNILDSDADYQELKIKFWYYLQNYIVSLGNVSKLLNRIQKLNISRRQIGSFKVT